MVSTETNAFITQYAMSLIDALYSLCQQDARKVLMRLVLHPEDTHVREIIKLGRLRHAISFLCEKQRVIPLYSFAEYREMLMHLFYVCEYSMDTRARMLAYLINQGKQSIPGFDGLSNDYLELMYDEICKQDATRIDVVQLLLQNGLLIRKFILYQAVIYRAMDIFVCILQFVKEHDRHDTHVVSDIKHVYEIVQGHASTLQMADYDYLDTDTQNRLILYVECMSLMSQVISVS
eukprot:1162104-Pelagomonas_calceolata.AAC.4